MISHHEQKEIAPDQGGTIYVADVCGPGWWGALHGVVEAINCSSCRDHGVELMGAMHDLVNWYLGKPIFNAKGFAVVAAHYAKALAEIKADKTVYQHQELHDDEGWTLDVDAEDELIDVLPDELQGGRMAQDVIGHVIEHWATSDPSFAQANIKITSQESTDQAVFETVLAWGIQNATTAI